MSLEWYIENLKRKGIARIMQPESRAHVTSKTNQNYASEVRFSSTPFFFKNKSEY
jgi:hypothetical protein